jgi:methyltransferase (TIGR00027 family)
VSECTTVKVGARVIVSCISKCMECDYCRAGLTSHCKTLGGIGWILGHLIDGTQAEYVRVPFADNGLIPLPDGVTAEQGAMLSDILPTGYEIGVLYGEVKEGDVVAVIGAGPVGLAGIMTAAAKGASTVIAVDGNKFRLEESREFGATDTIDITSGDDVLAELKKLSCDGLGVDVAIEAVGIPATFAMALDSIRPGGPVANVGVHGAPVSFPIERDWINNITITNELAGEVCRVADHVSTTRHPTRCVAGWRRTRRCETARVSDRAASATAVLVCQGRAAADGRYAVGRFSDPVARQLLDPTELQLVDAVRSDQRPHSGAHGMAWEMVWRTGQTMVPRTIMIDDAIREHGASQLVVLGAGLDARAWRMAELAGTTVFEVDHPESQRDKLRRLGALHPLAARVVPVAVDLMTEPLGPALEAAGFDPTAVTTWVWEGVVPYLPAEAVRSTVWQLARLSSPGSRLVVNYQAKSLPVPVM